MVHAALWIVAFLAQERNFSVVLPELQYSKYCSSEISLRNTSPRFVDVDIAGHKSTGALVGLLDRRSNGIRLRPSERSQVRLAVENDVAWAEITEIVPHPRLNPALAITATTECLDVNELLTSAREIAPVMANPEFNIDYSSASANGLVLLLINVSAETMHWTACYSAGHTISDGNGRMTPFCTEVLNRALGPYESSRLPASLDRKPLVQFRAEGPAVAVQMLAPSALHLQLYKVESTIRFDEPIQNQEGRGPASPIAKTMYSLEPIRAKPPLPWS